MLPWCNSESSKKQPQPHICFCYLLSAVCPSAITRQSSTTTTPSNGKSPTIKAQSTESTRHESTDGHRQPQPPSMAIVDHRDHHHHGDFHGTYTRRVPSSHSPQPTVHSPHRPAGHLPPTTATTARITTAKSGGTAVCIYFFGRLHLCVNYAPFCTSPQGPASALRFNYYLLANTHTMIALFNRATSATLVLVGLTGLFTEMLRQWDHHHTSYEFGAEC